MGGYREEVKLLVQHKRRVRTHPIPTLNKKTTEQAIMAKIK